MLKWYKHHNADQISVIDYEAKKAALVQHSSLMPTMPPFDKLEWGGTWRYQDTLGFVEREVWIEIESPYGPEGTNVGLIEVVE